MRKNEYFRWIANKLFSGVGLTSHDKAVRQSTAKRDVITVCLSALSVFIYWFCFINSSVPEIGQLLAFFVYLIPIEIVTVMYGWGGGIMCFTAVFVAAVIMSPGYAYFPFYHLVAVYIISQIKRKKLCRSIWRSLLWGIISGFVLSLVYYLVFILVTVETFAMESASEAALDIVNIIPQSVVICLFLYWFDNKCSVEKRAALGCMDEEIEAFIAKVGENIRKGYRSLSGKLFALLLAEAVIMGVAAAFFANSLIPKMMEDYQSKMESDASASYDLYKPSEKPDQKPDEETSQSGITPPEGFNEAFEAARSHAPLHKFSYDDQGISFDIKLIMMLLCVVHPIVLICNFVGQKLVAVPISDIANVVSDFGEDEKQRLLVLRNLSELNIHSEDEIELLYKMIHKMMRELNSYIDDIKHEQQLKEDLRVAKAASEAKSNFLSNMSHEIRTPINAVIGLDEMILRESGEENIRKYAVDIKNSGKTLLGLINDLLDFSKIEAGKLEIIPTEYELSSAINDLINMISAKASEKGLELIVDVAQDIPHVLYGDEIRIKQCVLNILNNAVKYTHEGSVKLAVSSKRISDDEISLRVSVTDTGIGIKEEDLSKLFSPFERIEESRNRTIEGTGLGMSIVKQLLDLMGSRLDVRSVYGEGSEFSFEVTQRVADHEPIGDFNETYLKSVNSLEQYHVSFVAPDAHILVVDDTPMNLNVIKGLLKQTLIQIDTAESGRQCLELAQKKHYDIILMDQRMPEMDGVETLHALQEMSATVNKSAGSPVIVLTANVVSGARERFLSEGFSDYLSKPVDAVKLEKVIARTLPPQKVLAARDADCTDTQEYDRAFITKLDNVEGIDASVALSNCMTQEILKNAVHDFYVSVKSQPDRIEQLLKNGNIREYTVAVHALKSSARLIGATDLSERAAALETMGDDNDREGIMARNPEMLSIYRAFYDKLKPICEEDASDAAGNKETIGAEQLSEAYAAIKEAAAAFDFDTADEIIKMLGDYSIPEEEAERFTRISDLITRLDRDALMEEL